MTRSDDADRADAARVTEPTPDTDVDRHRRDLERRDRILQAVAYAAGRLLRGGDWERDVDAALTCLGEATGVSRVYVFENDRGPGGEVVTSYRFEWTAPGIEPQIDHPGLQGLAYETMGYGRWARELSQERAIHGDVPDFPTEEQALLREQDIRSIVCVPIFLAGRWWGFMGFDECVTDRRWSEPEVDALRVAADVLGAAMQQQRAREALLHSRQAYASAYQREREAVERLRRLDDMKDSFLEAVSHELRTPLAGVLGLAETVRQHLDRLPPEQVRQLTTRIAANARRLDRMLANLLDVSRLQRGALTAKRTWVETADLVSDVVRECDVIDGREVVIDVQVDRLHVDPAQVERILDNLLRNAVRHGADDGPVWIRVEAVGDDDVVLVIEDAGEGVPDEYKRLVFQPFERGPAVERHRPGTGIGLALVARLASLHGGRAWIEDRPGGGASVRVRFDAARLTGQVEPVRTF